jgi:hypothetical protein
MSNLRKFVHIALTKQCIYVCKVNYSVIATCFFLKTLHPGGIRARVFCFPRWMQCLLHHVLGLIKMPIYILGVNKGRYNSSVPFYLRIFGWNCVQSCLNEKFVPCPGDVVYVVVDVSANRTEDRGFESRQSIHYIRCRAVLHNLIAKLLCVFEWSECREIF